MFTVHTGNYTGHDAITQYPYERNAACMQNKAETITSSLKASLRFLSSQCQLTCYTDFQQHG